jgi:hypothetical protein
MQIVREAKMTGMTDPRVVRDWLGLYVLVLTGIVGTYLLVAPDPILPLDSEEKTASFEIIIPFLLAQVTAVFRYFTHTRPSEQPIPIPTWVVKAPPIIASMSLMVGFLIMGFGGVLKASWVLSPGQFKGLLTFVVSLLSASSLFVITRYFEVEKPATPELVDAANPTGSATRSAIANDKGTTT